MGSNFKEDTSIAKRSTIKWWLVKLASFYLRCNDIIRGAFIRNPAINRSPQFVLKCTWLLSSYVEICTLSVVPINWKQSHKSRQMLGQLSSFRKCWYPIGKLEIRPESWSGVLPYRADQGALIWRSEFKVRAKKINLSPPTILRYFFSVGMIYLQTITESYPDIGSFAIKLCTQFLSYGLHEHVCCIKRSEGLLLHTNYCRRCPTILKRTVSFNAQIYNISSDVWGCHFYRQKRQFVRFISGDFPSNPKA